LGGRVAGEKKQREEKRKEKGRSQRKRLGFSQDVLVDTEMDDDKSRNVGTRQRWIRARTVGSCQPLAVI
jgi:hypothetical protein